MSVASSEDVLKALTKERKVDIVRDDETKKVIIPKNMKLGDVIRWLKRQQAAEETEISFVKDFPYHPADGAVQLAEVLKEKYGWAALVPTEGFFKVPPKMRSIQISNTETVKVPWGNMKIPGIEGTISVGGFRDPETQLLRFQIQADVWKRDVDQIDEICQAIHNRMPEKSIYRGRSIQATSQGDVEFLEPSAFFKEDLILPEDVEAQVNANIFTPIEFTEAVVEAGVPLKRGVLLSGDYGTGKTLTGTVCSSLCEINGWTYIMVSHPRELVTTLQMAKLYQPAVVYCEDIDQIATGVRTEDVNTLLEAVD